MSIRGLTRLSGVLLGLVAIAFAVAGLTVEFAARRALAFVDAFSAGNVISADGARRLVDHRESEWTATHSCRRDVLIAIGRIEVNALDALVAAGEVGRIEPSIRRVERSARRVLSCSPGESAGWLWLAMARDELRSADGEVRDALARSQETGPAEPWLITTRLPFAAELVSRRGAEFEPNARADLRMLFASAATAAEVADVLAPVHRWIRPISDEEFAGIADERRREELTQAFGRHRVNIANCPREAFVDWLYRGQRGSCLTGDSIPHFDWQAPKE